MSYFRDEVIRMSRQIDAHLTRIDELRSKANSLQRDLDCFVLVNVGTFADRVEAAKKRVDPDDFDKEYGGAGRYIVGEAGPELATRKGAGRPKAGRNESATVNLNVTGDVSKKTKKAIKAMMPSVTEAVVDRLNERRGVTPATLKVEGDIG